MQYNILERARWLGGHLCNQVHMPFMALLLFLLEVRGYSQLYYVHGHILQEQGTCIINHTSTTEFKVRVCVPCYCGCGHQSRDVSSRYS